MTYAHQDFSAGDRVNVTFTSSNNHGQLAITTEDEGTYYVDWIEGVFQGDSHFTTNTAAITGSQLVANGLVVYVDASSDPDFEFSISCSSGASAPSITGQPSDSAINTGGSTTFSVTASNATGYQWQVNTGSGFTAINDGGVYSGATSATLTIAGATAGMSGDQYRVVVSGSATPDATSNAATLTVNRLNPAVALSASSITPAFGESVTFTATLSGGSSPSGTVTFKDGSTTLGTGTISGSTATFSTTALTVGGHTITAEYAGDTNNTTATSSATTVTVAQPAAPAVAGVSVPANGRYKIGDSLSFVVNFDQSVMVTGTPSLTITIGSVSAPATYIAGSGTDGLFFQYTVRAGDGDTDGISLGAMSLNGGSIQSAGGTNAVLTLNSVGSTAGVFVDGISPTVLSTQVDGTPSAGAASAEFAVQFSEPVSGFSLSNVTLASTGSAAATISNISGSGANYLIAVTAVSGSGTLRLDVSSPSGITDQAGNALAASYTSGSVWTVTPSPVVLSPATGTVLSAGTVGTAYSNTSISASGGSGAISFAASGLPAGLSISSSTGAITGTPTTAGNASITVTATDAASTSVSASYTIAISATPTSLSILPASGTTLSGGTVGTAYSNTSISASGGTGAISFSASGLPAGLSISSSTGAITGTPTTAGNASVTVTATDAASASVSASYTLAISAASTPLSILPASGTTLSGGTVGTAYSNTAISASGGTGAIRFAASGLPAGLSISSSTGAISGTPTTAGNASVTVTATDAASASVSASYTLAISAASTPLSILPASGTTLSGGTVGTAYSNTAISASGGTGAIRFAASGLPAGLSISSSTGAISGTPTTAGNASVTVTATDAASASVSASYTIAISAAPASLSIAPATGTALSSGMVGTAYSNTSISASGGSGAIRFAASGLPAGLSISSSTGAITGTPTTAGNAGVTVTATDAASTSVSASYTIAISAAPTPLSILPASGTTLSAGTVGTAYSNTNISTSGGSGAIRFAASGLPAGLSMNTSTGAITGTPTTAGNASVTVTATDAASISVSATYSLTVNPAAATTFVFTPPGGALTAAMVGEDYSQPISAKGGHGVLIYSLASGSLPKGVTLNISTGALTGPLSTDAEAKDYSFTIGVRDAQGATGTASYTLKANPRAVTVIDQIVNVPAGSSPADVYLNRDATGGPFTTAATTFVEPANAGTVTIIRGQLAQAGPVTAPVGWYLHFTPDPAYSGQVRVGFRLTSALGISNTGTVTYNLSYDPAKVASDIDRLVHDFVRTRQNMIVTTIEVPGLLERRQMEQATDPVTARMTPSEDGLTVNFSTSLAQLEAAKNGGAEVSAGYSSPFNIWIDGAFLAHNDKDINGNKWGSFAMLSAGADYLLSDKALVGLSFHYDRMTDPTDTDAELTGNGWMAGPYASFELGKGVFWNASLLYGGSSNDIDTEFWDGTFDTTRWMADTSIEGQWDLSQDTVLTPKLRAVYFSETVDDYTVKNGAGDALTIDGFNEDQFRVSLGAEIARSFTLENGAKLTPKLGLTGGFSGLDGSGAFGTVKAGLSMQTTNFWMLDASLLFDIEGEGEKSVGAKVGAAKKF